MTQTIQAVNINGAYPDGLWWLKTAGEKEQTRNGMAIVSPVPVITCYKRPWERVLFNTKRNANPFFHLAEAIWMLAGSCDGLWLAKYNKQMLEYADDKVHLNGAYGYRWREFFDYDQLYTIIKLLRKDPTTRQAVLAMWNPSGEYGKDVPCNTHCYFRNYKGTLEMTVTCRSNDAIWGAYGANVVHFSVVHEFIARAAGIPQGKMYQVSNNFHIYEQHWPLLEFPTNDIFQYPTVIPLLNENGAYWEDFLWQCEMVVRGMWNVTFDPFFKDVVLPMLIFWDTRDIQVLLGMPDCDWRLAALNWTERKYGAKAA